MSWKKIFSEKRICSASPFREIQSMGWCSDHTTISQTSPSTDGVVSRLAVSSWVDPGLTYLSNHGIIALHRFMQQSNTPVTAVMTTTGFLETLIQWFVNMTLKFYRHLIIIWSWNEMLENNWGLMNCLIELEQLEPYSYWRIIEGRWNDAQIVLVWLLVCVPGAYLVVDHTCCRSHWLFHFICDVPLDNMDNIKLWYNTICCVWFYFKAMYTSKIETVETEIHQMSCDCS